jgi:hypothetical protein
VARMARVKSGSLRAGKVIPKDVRDAYQALFYSGRTEGDVMWSAIRMVQGQLAEAGFAPR